MNTAHIVPINELRPFEWQLGEFHLVLAQLVEKFRYRHFYTTAAKRGHYVILDNGAHENGVGMSIDNLLYLARTIGAREIVLPDALFDAATTVQLVADACVRLKNPSIDDPKLEAIMVVPQAASVLEWRNCLDAIVGYAHDCGPRVVIGVSKDYETFPSGLHGLVEYIEKRYKRHFAVHLLGWGRQLYRLSELAKAFPWIRSIDSAKPASYAFNSITLPRNLEYSPPYSRSSRFFEATFNDLKREIAAINMGIFDRAAKGRI